MSQDMTIYMLSNLQEKQAQFDDPEISIILSSFSQDKHLEIVKKIRTDLFHRNKLHDISSVSVDTPKLSLYLIMLHSLHGQIPRLKITSTERAFAQHKKCFKTCLKGFDTGNISQDQKTCVISCLSKYRDSQRYLAEKVHKLMTEHASQNQEISALYDMNLDGGHKH